MRKFLAGPANVVAMSGDNIIFESKTILDSSITVGTTAAENRTGQGNQLFGRYFHTSTFGISLTDTMFKLDYLALVTGSTMSQGADIFKNESLTLDSTGSGTITGVPVNAKAYVRLRDAEDYITVDVASGAFTHAAYADQDVCVKYVSKDLASNSIRISADIIPSEVTLYMTASLFRAGKNNSMNTSSKVGEVTVTVPRFQFDGSMELALTSTGMANIPLTGSALAVEDTSCDATSGYYADIAETIFGDDAYSDVVVIGIENGEDISVATTETSVLVCYGIRGNGLSFVISNDALDFSSTDDTIATVDATGTITGVAAGNCNIQATLKAKSTVGGTAYVTVT